MGLRYGTPLLRWRQSSSMVSGILTIWSPWSIKDLPKSWRSLGGFPSHSYEVWGRKSGLGVPNVVTSSHGTPGLAAWHSFPKGSRGEGFSGGPCGSISPRAWTIFGRGPIGSVHLRNVPRLEAIQPHPNVLSAASRIHFR